MILRRWAAMLLLMGLFVSCPDLSADEAGKPEGAVEGDEAILLGRAKAYWEARFSQDMQRAFTLEDPVRQKNLNLIKYIRMVGDPGKVYAVTVKGVKIQGDQADVEVEMHYRHTIPPWDKQILKSTLTDDWQKIDGVWYHVLDLHLIRTGKPRVFVDRGTIGYPPAERNTEEEARGVAGKEPGASEPASPTR